MYLAACYVFKLGNLPLKMPWQERIIKWIVTHSFVRIQSKTGIIVVNLKALSYHFDGHISLKSQRDTPWCFYGDTT